MIGINQTTLIPSIAAEPVINSRIINPPPNVSELIQDILTSVRLRLDMEVAFVSRFVDGKRQFQYVDFDQDCSFVSPGDSDPLDKSYCYRVVRGITPPLIIDATKDKSVADLEATHLLPVGAHISVPIFLNDGSVYGTFCAFSRKPNEELSAADISCFQVFSEVVASMLNRHSLGKTRYDELRSRVLTVLENDQLSMVTQPIVALHTAEVVGFEVLARIDHGRWAPDNFFAGALEVGLSPDANKRAVEKALKLLPQLDEDAYLAINVTPDFLLREDFPALFSGVPSHRIVLEITEHSAITNYNDLNRLLAPFRARGMRISVDDAGAGYASFRHILLLRPDIVKVDRSLIENIDIDVEKQALVSALIQFTSSGDQSLVAEGVETEAECRQLLALGVSYAQGYYFARPNRPEHFSEFQH